MNSRDRARVRHVVSYDAKNRARVFLSQELIDQVEILLLLSRHVQFQLLKELTNEQIVALVNFLDSDDATDIIQLVSKDRQKQIIGELSEHLRESVAVLLNFDPETAAGLMNVDYVLVKSDETIASTAQAVKKHEKRTGKLPTILVADEGKLLGQIPGHELAFAKPGELVSKYIKKINTIAHDTKAREVVNHFRSHPHSKVVVMGESGQVLGLIYTDDILKLIQADDSASLYDFAGVSSEESIYDTTARKVQFRYKWLIINLGTAFLAAFTVGLFDEVISRHVLLAIYMPIVAGMGGNAGTQTLAVMVRGLSQNNIDLKRMLTTLRREILAGVINGILNGIIVTGVVYFLNGDLMVGIVLGMAMIVNLFIAGTFGTLVPVVMKRLGKDPASSATIFITTATDVFGFLAFLGLATLLLK